MEHIVTSRAVSSVKTRTVSRMMEIVYLALMVPMERCVTRSAQDIAQGINVTNLLMPQSAPVSVRLAFMAQVAIRIAHLTA